MYPSWSLKRRYVPDMMIRCKREAGNIGLSLFLDTQSGLFAGVGEWGCLVLGLGVWGGGGGDLFDLPLLWISHRRHYFPSYFSAGV